MSFVTVVVPAYNPNEYLIEAVQSAVDQSYPDMEVVVVDDGSTARGSDGHFRAAERLGARVLRTENRGVAAARNAGIAAGRDDGDYILPLDADDRLEPGSVALAAAVLDEDSRVGVVAGAQRLIGARSGENPCAYNGIDSMLKATTIPNISMFRRQDWDAAGGYPEQLKLGEDWAFWMRILKLGREVKVLPQVLHEYRISAAQTTAKFDPINVALAQNLVLQENLELYAKHPESLAADLVDARMLLAHYRENYRLVDLTKKRVAKLLRR